MAVNQLLKNAFVAYSELYCALVDEMRKLPARAQEGLRGFEIESRMATTYFWELLMTFYDRRSNGRQREVLRIPEQILVQAKKKAGESIENLAVAVAGSQNDINGLVGVLSVSLAPYYAAQEYFPLGTRAGATF